jgi:hypothetical protein
MGLYNSLYDPIYNPFEELKNWIDKLYTTDKKILEIG